MSYILDALRRAEAQRSRGRVPGLHEASGPVVPANSPTAASRRPMIFALALLLLLGLLILIWQLIDRQAGPSGGTEPAARATAESSRGELASAPPPAVSSSVAEPASDDTQRVVSLPRKAQVPDRRPESRAAAPAPPPIAQAAAPKPSAVPAPPAAAIASRATNVVPAGQRPGSTVLTRQELPAEIQRSLPPITVSGTVYSSDPTQRMIVVNGELWHEGDQIRPDLVLEQIRRRDAILRFRGYRFSAGP